MIFEINERGQVRLKDIFEPVELVSKGGQSILVCLRDDGRGDFSPDGTRSFNWHTVSNDGSIEIMACQEG